MGFFVCGMMVRFVHELEKKPASPMIRNIVLGVMAICVIVMILIGQYMASSVFALIILGDILTNKNRTK